MSTWTLADLIGDQEEITDIPNQLWGDLPIQSPEKLDWNRRENPNRLTKMFNFSAEDKFNAFVMELLELQSETGHHGRITLQYPQVKIEVWTHTLDDITEIDVEWAQKVNDIWGDFQ